MKKICVLMLLTVFLSGCRAEQTWETVEDIVPAEVLPVAQFSSQSSSTARDI